MNPKQQINHLVDLVKARLPEATIKVDAPSRASGDWFVDVDAEGLSLVVELRPKLGFGLSSPSDDAFGEGPDEFLEDAEAVAERIVELVRSRQPTVPQRVRLLQELREQRRVSQVELATKLGVRQPTVSKIERRDDVALSTLRRYVEALGGELHVTAQFTDGKFEIELDDHASG